MSKSITEQIQELQIENERLKELKKISDKIIKAEFSIEAKKIHKILDTYDAISLDFANEIKKFFDLKTEQDIADFIAVFCASNSLDYFQNHREKSVTLRYENTK